MWIQITTRSKRISSVDRHSPRAHKRRSSVKLLSAFIASLMFGGHTRRLVTATDTKKSDFKNGEWWMDLFVAVGVLFAIGYAAGFGFRSLTAHMREQRSPYRPMSSLRDFDHREDPAWTR